MVLHLTRIERAVAWLDYALWDVFNVFFFGIIGLVLLCYFIPMIIGLFVGIDITPKDLD